MLIGMGAFLPGISGGNLAIAFGVYGRIMDTIAHPFRQLKKNIVFFLPYIIGGAAGFFVAAFLLEQLFSRWEMELIFLFAGCIAGTLPSLRRDAVKTAEGTSDRTPSSGRHGIKPSYAAVCIAFFSVTACSILLPAFLSGSAEIGNAAAGIGLTGIPFFPRWVICGIIIGFGIIVPGTSASIILMYLGMYERLLAAVSHVQIHVLVPVVLGIIAVVILFSRVISWLFRRFPAGASFAVLGLVTASILIIVPYTHFTLRTIRCALFLLAGMAVTFICTKLPSPPAE